MKLAIGMPVFERAWILPIWFKCLEAQELAPKEDIALCFAYSKGFDGTYEVLRHYGEQYGNLMIYEYDLRTYAGREDMSRFHELTALRNGLLEMARETQADYFLSWDNDILFPPGRLQYLFDSAGPNKAVGACMDMGGNNENMGYPSVMQFSEAEGELAFRQPWSTYNHEEPFPCDVIMAVKLMGKEVYSNTKYRWDPLGEDIGWSIDAAEKGYERWFDPRAVGYHVYDRQIATNIMRRSKKDYPEILEDLSIWYRHPNG